MLKVEWLQSQIILKVLGASKPKVSSTKTTYPSSKRY